VIRLLLFAAFFFALNASAIGQQSQSGVKPQKIKSVFFGGGQYELDEDQIDDIKEFLENELLDYHEIHIHSHTDNIGSKAYNKYLSSKRSEFVIQLIVPQIMPANQIFIQDHGLERPDFDNRTYQGRAHNRRVDIVLWPPKT